MMRRMLCMVLFVVGLLALSARGQSTYYLNYAGSDANNGTTAATPVKNISKINTLLAAVTTPVRVIIDTHTTPLYMDEQFVVHDNMTVVGQGDVAFTSAGGKVIKGLADLRPWKIIAANTWSATAGKTRTYQTTDTTATAYLWKYAGWTGHTQPLQQLTKVNGANYAAVATSLDAAAGKFFTDGTNMYLSSDTNPASDGSSYARSVPNLMTSAAFGDLTSRGDATGGKNPLVVFGNGQVNNLAIGGCGAASATGTTTIAYAAILSPGLTSQISMQGCLVYMGSYHSLGIYSSLAGTAADQVTLTDVRWEQGATSDTIAGILYFAASTGHTITMTRVKCAYGTALAGSTEGTDAGSQCLGGHGNAGGIGSLVIRDSELGSDQNSATNRMAIIFGETVADNALQILGGYTGQVQVDGSAYYATHFNNGLPACSTSSGKTQTLRNCTYIPKLSDVGMISARQAIHGTYDIQHCYIDLTGSTAGYFDNHIPPFFYDSVAFTLTFKNNVFISGFSPVAGLVTGLTNISVGTFDIDYNAFACTRGSGTVHVLQTDENNALVTDAQLNSGTNGIGTHNLVYNSTFAISDLVQATGVPQAESPLLGAASDGGPIGVGTAAGAQTPGLHPWLGF